MIYTPLTKKALKLCFDCHKDQLDKSGMPYVFHPFHLAEQMEDELTTIVSLLHDVVEDTPCTLYDLAGMGFPEEALEAIALMTHDDAVPYLDYVANIRKNPIARTVKLADLRHNSDLSRLEYVDAHALARAEKYAAAIRLLEGCAMPETRDLILRHPDFSDWQDMYHNVWSRPETAKYMLWNVTDSEEAAQDRMIRSIAWQEKNPCCWFVYEKISQRAIGFGGMTQIAPGIWEDTGIALGPDYVGRGYGRQVLTALADYAKQEMGAHRFVCSCRSANAPSRGMILACGFRFTHWEERTDPRTGDEYRLEFYEKNL